MGMLEAITHINPNLDAVVEPTVLSEARTRHMVETDKMDKALTDDEVWERFRTAYNKAAGFDDNECE